MTVKSNDKGTALWNAMAHMPSIAGNRLTIVEGEGCYVRTDDGRRLLDATAGLFFTNVGHGRESIARAGYNQMRKLETHHVFGRFCNDRAIDLADRVAAMQPIKNAKIFWTSGGGDSVELACKLARRHWQLEGRASKRTVLSRDLSYHGMHAYGTSVAGLDFNREGYGTESLIPETARISNSDLAQVQAQIEALGADNIAAIIAEPVIGTGGIIPPTDGYLAGLQQLAHANDILFIADEVITGFGRLGQMFACQRFDLQPDMMLVAKGISSGYSALGGVFIAPRIWNRFFNTTDAPTFRHGLTYSGHATTCAIADANLDILDTEDLVGRVATLEAPFAAAVEPLRSHPLVKQTRSIGLLAGIELHPDVPAEQVVASCIEAGVITRVISNNTLQISPPFIVTEDEIRGATSAIEQGLDKLHANGW